jgi:quaternary ammonium compound-resistance protein SugE
MKKHWILLTAIVFLLIGLLVVTTHGNQLSIGNFNFNYFSSGNYAMGVFAAGNFSIGIFSAGIFSIGIFSIGIFNVGLYALGIFLLAWKKKLPYFFDQHKK